jgi:hypothetical protein
METMYGDRKFRFMLKHSFDQTDEYESTNHDNQDAPMSLLVPHSISRLGQTVTVALDVTVRPRWDM